jgi:hypothetical protein
VVRWHAWRVSGLRIRGETGRTRRGRRRKTIVGNGIWSLDLSSRTESRVSNTAICSNASVSGFVVASDHRTGLPTRACPRHRVGSGANLDRLFRSRQALQGTWRPRRERQITGSMRAELIGLRNVDPSRLVGASFQLVNASLKQCLCLEAQHGPEARLFVVLSPLCARSEARGPSHREGLLLCRSSIEVDEGAASRDGEQARRHHAQRMHKAVASRGQPRTPRSETETSTRAGGRAQTRAREAGGGRTRREPLC